MHRTGYLFLRPDGLPHSPHSVSERVSRHFRAIGMGYTAHQLRHRFGTRALELTQNLRVVQEQMGHASPATTQVYTLVSRQETIDLAKALDVEVGDSRRK
jgi:integrase